MSTEVHMKYHLVLALTFLGICAASAAAHADTLLYAVNNGLGDNFAYIGQSDGHQYTLNGGTSTGFLGTGGYDPGSILGGQTTLYLYITTIWVNGAPVDFMFPSPPATLFMTSFTLPTSGQDFRVLVQISFSASGIAVDRPDLAPISLSGSTQGWIDFSYSNGRYYPSDFVPATVPEPASLVLSSTGLAAIAVAARRRCRTRGSV